MAFQLSPGVNVSEIDLTTVVPAVATTEGAIAGVFRWGPVDERTLITSEKELVQIFGRPTTIKTTTEQAVTTWTNHETWFSAANFLAYSDALYVTRVVGTTAAKSVATSYIQAKYNGEIGNTLQVAYINGNGSLESTLSTDTMTIAASASTGIVISSASTVVDYIAKGDAVEFDAQTFIVSNVGAPVEQFNPLDPEVSLGIWHTTVTFTNRYVAAEAKTAAFSYKWGYSDLFASAPSTNTVHLVVIDQDGLFSGVPGTILEKFDGLSSQESARNSDGSSNYIRSVLDQRSNYIEIKGTTEVEVLNNISNIVTAVGEYGYLSLTGGNDGGDEATIAIGDLVRGYDTFKSADEVDVSLIITGKRRTSGLQSYIIDNICESRKDCIAFISPSQTSNTAEDLVSEIADGSVTRSSYAVVDSGYKYQYDKYNDLYRWIPLNGDIAGLCARTDDERDPWFSPAGYNRGVIKNVIKLSFNPNKAQRDLLYKNGINPVITQPGQGTVLFGDKTFLGNPSAFDRINVRRLFIVLEKAISRASKSTLFEFNDRFTRAQFVNLVEPFLRDVQGRRGIFDYRVVCDETNNTAEVVDRNEFIGDIFIKPARSINFIQLNFVAVRSGVEFNEIVGSV